MSGEAKAMQPEDVTRLVAERLNLPGPEFPRRLRETAPAAWFRLAAGAALRRGPGTCQEDGGRPGGL
jgi:hypothetical protein